MTRHPSPPSANLPAYCCGIITNNKNYLLLQLRPATAQHAPRQLTCFGGKREPDESMEGCLLRELNEELRWSPTSLTMACDLWQGPHFIARFFRCEMMTDELVTTERGHLAIWTPFCCLPALPLSPWHAAVLHAVAQGSTRAEIPTP